MVSPLTGRSRSARTSGAMRELVTTLSDDSHWLLGFWSNQLGGMFLSPGSSFSVVALLLTLLLAAFLAVPRGRRTMPRFKVWRRALFPRRLTASASGRADIAWFAFSVFGYGLLFGWALLSSASVAATMRALIGPVTPLALPPAMGTGILTLLLFIAFEFAYWLDHYLSHTVPLLWQFHRVHHSAESLSLLTNARVHPVDTIVYTNIVAVVLGIVQGIAAPLLGGSTWQVGGVNVLVIASAVALNHLQHSHLWITFGPRWGRWLLSPAHHQIHHSIDTTHHDRNFGSTLAVFDRLFGTLHMPAARREPLRFGVEGQTPRPHGWRAALIDPFAGALALIPVPRRARSCVTGESGQRRAAWIRYATTGPRRSSN